MLKSIFGHVKTVVTLGKNENNYNMLCELTGGRVLLSTFLEEGGL